MKINLQDRVAVVTGATRGIGFSIAQKLAESGCKLACIGTNSEKLNAAVEEIKKSGATANAYICNVADAAQVEAAAKKILEDFGKRVDILVNNAGITRDMLIRRLTDADWDDVIAINLRGTFLMTRAFVETMRKAKWGRIINISSVSGIRGNRGQCNYSASKAGLIGFTQTVALELANRGITVNAVAPGFIATDMTSVLDPIIITEATNRIPVGRIGKPEEIASAVAFLASEEAAYITGQCLTVDGGMTV